VNNDKKIKSIMKRSMDVMLLFFIAPIVVPLILVILLAVILEQLIFRDFGPLVISEMRISKGKKFRLYKLNVYKELTRKKYVLESDRYAQMGTYDYLGLDPSSFRLVGRVMKKYYLDELGQMVNILFGHMSFVGPRPRLEREEITMSPPWQLLKTGYFCFPANSWKNEQPSSLGFHSDQDYLDLYQNSSTFELLRSDVCLILEGLKAVIKGKGK
jgi:hypothetical protein